MIVENVCTKSELLSFEIDFEFCMTETMKVLEFHNIPYDLSLVH